MNDNSYIKSRGYIDGKYVPKTKEQIKHIAIGMRDGSIFTSMQIHEHDYNLLGSIFMPLIFMNYVQIKSMNLMEITHFYGSIPGKPCLSTDILHYIVWECLTVRMHKKSVKCMTK